MQTLEDGQAAKHRDGGGDLLQAARDQQQCEDDDCRGNQAGHARLA